MKFSQSIVSSALLYVGVGAGMSVGLLACGSGSSSNSAPNLGVGGTASPAADIAPGCANPIHSADAGRSPVTDQNAIPNADFKLTRLTMYGYNPGTGDSYTAIAGETARGFEVSTPCNITNHEEGRHTEKAFAPEMLEASRKLGAGDQQLEIELNFANAEIEQAKSSDVPDESGMFVFDHIGRGRELVAPNTYATYQVLLTQNGTIEVRSKREYPSDPNSGKGKLVFTAAEYEPTRPGENGHK